MLKSLSTQFAATLFFGPMGLAYSSMAAAVFLTLILAVLYFTELSMLAVVIMWPIAIATGLVLVKLHNNQIRSSGGMLLLGPDGEVGDAVSTFGSWGRGVAVLSLLAVGGYAAYWYSGQQGSGAGGETDYVAISKDVDTTLTGSVESARIADSTELDAIQFGDDQMDQHQVVNLAASVAITESVIEVNRQDSIQVAFQGAGVENDTVEKELAIAKTYPVDSDEPVEATVHESISESGGTLTVLTSGQEQVASVIIEPFSELEALNGALYYVASEMVNLREGPGTNFSILDQVVRGDELSAVERAGSWMRVNATGSGATGWIFSRLVSTQP